MDELEQLQAAAVAADASALPPPPADPNAPPPPPPVDYALEAAGAVDMFTALVVGYAPKTAEIWTDATKARVSSAMAPVMEKYGFTFGAIPPELTLLIVAGPPLFQSSRLIAAQMADDKKKAKPPAEPPVEGAAPPAADSPELAMHPQMALYR